MNPKITTAVATKVCWSSIAEVRAVVPGRPRKERSNPTHRGLKHPHPEAVVTLSAFCEEWASVLSLKDHGSLCSQWLLL